MFRLSGLLFLVLLCTYSFDVAGAPMVGDQTLRVTAWQDTPHNSPLDQKIRLSADSEEKNRRAFSKPEPVLIVEKSREAYKNGAYQFSHGTLDPLEVNRLYFDDEVEGSQDSQIAFGLVSDDLPMTRSALPDLTVTEMNGPLTGIAGEPIEISASTLNQGDASAGPYRLNFFLSTNSTISLADQDTN